MLVRGELPDAHSAAALALLDASGGVALDGAG
jgi:hypothetical protein